MSMGTLYPGCKLPTVAGYIAMLIRPVQPADFTPIAALTNHYIEHTTIHFGYEPVTLEELRAAWEKGRERYPYFIAEIDGAFAGYAKAGVWRERAAYQWTAEAGIYVEQRFQGRGVGTRLYRALIDECRRCGFHTLVAGVTLPNDASVKLHEAVGFVRVGTFRRVGWKRNTWCDVGWFEMPLRDALHVPGAITRPDHAAS